MKWPAFSLLFLWVIGLASCTTQQEEKQVTRGFYYWQNTYKLNQSERTALEQLQVKRLYIRLFDIDWLKEYKRPGPLQGINFSQTPDSLEVVPVVYITETALRNATQAQIDELAIFLYEAMSGLNRRFPHLTVTEWQFDCDWTETTRDKYFGMLRQIKELLKQTDVKLSATIRLHQIKYQKRTGIPPVDRGILMYYNMGKLADTLETNSIYNDATAANYMTGFDTYPLPLDVALPIFRWGVWFHNGRVQGLINGLKGSDVSEGFTTHPNFLEAVKDQWIKGHYVQKGDRIRPEYVSATALKQAAQRIAPLLSTGQINVVLYHLDSDLLNDHPIDQLHEIYNTFN